MSYVYKLLDGTPIGLWSLDAAIGGRIGGKFPDQSGYGNDATIIGGLTTVKPIVALGVAGQMLTGAGFTVPISSVMAKGTESKPFTFEFWFKHQTTTGTAALFARNNSGVAIGGNTITASIQMSTTISASYSGLIVGEIYHCLVTYDGQWLTLWLNGAAVASGQISPDDISAGFADTASSLSFSASGGYSIVLDSIAIYTYVLTSTDITDHYNYGLNYSDVVRTSGFNNSHQWTISDESVTKFTELLAETSFDWNLGLFSGAVTVNANNLMNSWSATDGKYDGGTWTQTINIEPTTLTLAGSRITWDSNKINSDIKVEYTTNAGVKWNAVTNGSSPFTNLNLRNGVDIQIRVTFAAGSSQTVLRRLHLVLYISKNIAGTNASLPITVNDPTHATLAEYDYPPASFNDNLGISLSSATNSLKIPSDAVFGGYQAIEMLVKFPAAGTSGQIITSASGGVGISVNSSGQWVSTGVSVLYIDGASAASPATISAGVWHHVIAVFPATAEDFYIGNNAAATSPFALQVGYVAGYFSTLSAAQISAIYNYWVGGNVTRVTDPNVVTVHEHAIDGSLPCRGYSYNWAVSPAG